MQSQDVHQFALRAVELKRQGRIDDSIRAYRLVYAVADEVNRIKNYAGFGKSLFIAGQWHESMTAFQALMCQSATHPSGRENYELSCLRAGTCQLQLARQSGQLASLVRTEALPDHQVDALVRHMSDSFMGRGDQRAFDLLLQRNFRVAAVLSPQLQSFASVEFGGRPGDVIDFMIVLRVLGTHSIDAARKSLLSLRRMVSCDEVERAVGFKSLLQAEEGRQAAFRQMESWKVIN